MPNETTNHLNYFKVQNFKCFDSLELEDIGKFNLILGDNNVGKTSALEALLFDKQPFRFLENLFSVFGYRCLNFDNPVNKIDYLSFYLNHKRNISSVKYNYRLKDDTAIENAELSIINSNNLTQEHIQQLIKNTLLDISKLPKSVVSIKLNEKEEFYTSDFNLHRVKDEVRYMPFIKSGLTYQYDLVDFYSKNITDNKRLKEEFIKNLNIISDNIYDLAIDTTTIPETPVLKALFTDSEKSLPLFMMGDGTIRLVRIILEIIMSKNSRLMIDEVDNGVHFSRIKEVWRTLIKVANKNNTQLFITTHNTECLKCFKEVLEENDFTHLQNDVRSYTLKKLPDNSIKAYKYNFEEFEHAINQEVELR